MCELPIPSRDELQADLCNAVAGNLRTTNSMLPSLTLSPTTGRGRAQQKLRNGEACIREIQPESINSIQCTQRRIGFDDEIAENARSPKRCGSRSASIRRSKLPHFYRTRQKVRVDRCPPTIQCLNLDRFALADHQ